MKLRNVDAYIASAPKEVQAKLHQLREIIRKAAPEAQEKISYGMPYYAFNGRLAYFSAWKEHIGLYITPPILEEFSDELADYETAKATLRLPLTQKLPVTLIRKLIKARVKRNAEAKKK